MVKIREITELAPVMYSDKEKKINIQCYADTLVYHEVNKNERNLVAMRYGGYPEHVRAMADIMKGEIGIETVVGSHHLCLTAKSKRYKKNVSHNGNYAEGMIFALDDENGEIQDEEKVVVKKPQEKRKMYIFCESGDTDSLFNELDKKTAIPLIPEFKDYMQA